MNSDAQEIQLKGFLDFGTTRRLVFTGTAIYASRSDNFTLHSLKLCQEVKLCNPTAERKHRLYLKNSHVIMIFAFI